MPIDHTQHVGIPSGSGVSEIIATVSHDINGNGKAYVM